MECNRYVSPRVAELCVSGKRLGRKRMLNTFEEFKADLDKCIHHCNKRRRQVRLKGLTPEVFREQALSIVVSIN